MRGAAHHCLVVVIAYCLSPQGHSQFSMATKRYGFKAEDKIMFIRVEVEEVPDS